MSRSLGPETTRRPRDRVQSVCLSARSAWLQAWGAWLSAWGAWLSVWGGFVLVLGDSSSLIIILSSQSLVPRTTAFCETVGSDQHRVVLGLPWPFLG